MSKNPNDKKDVGDASLLSAAMVGAPALGGFGYALRDMMKHKQFRPPRETSFASAARRLGGFAHAPGADTAQLFHDTGFLRTTSGGAIAKQAWATAFGSAGRAPSNLLNYASDLAGVPDTEAFNAIERTVQANQSTFMRRVASRFRQNVSAFHRQAQLTGKMPNFLKAENFRFPSAERNAALPPDIAPVFNRIRSTLGWGKADYYSRDGWKERGLGMYQLMFRHKNLEFTLPLPIANNGMLAEGLTQSSLKIAPGVHIYDPHSNQITHKMSRHEYVLRSFEEQIMPGIQSGKLKTSWDVQKSIDELYEGSVRALENVPNLPPGMENQGLKSYTTIRSNAVDIRVLDKNGFRAPSGREFTAAMKAGGYFPETSPSNLAAGRVSLHDPRGWSMTPTAEDMSRRIAQANRTYRPTQAAVNEMLKTKWAIFETQGWRKDMGPYAAPHFKALYINPDRHRKLLEKYAIGEGEYLIQNTGGNRRALETYVASTPARLKSIRDDIDEIIKTGNIKPGEVIGQTVEGTPFVYQKGMKLKGKEKFATLGSGEFYSLYYDQIQRVQEHTKGFLGAKGMRRLAPKEQFFGLQSDVARATSNSYLTSGMQMAINMDELKKNPARHNTQMITELWNLLDSMKTRDAIRRNKKLQVFLRNPTGTAGVMEKWATVGMEGGSRYDHEAFVKNLMKFALVEGNLNPEQFGSVFGAVPHVLGKEGVRRVYTDLALNQFSFRHLRAMHRGMAGGVAQTVFGGPKELTGAGSFGSLEPRAFEILRGGQFGALGGDITGEFMKRLAISNPDTFMTHDALTKSLRSAAGKVGAHGEIWDVSKARYSSEGFQEFIDRGGGFVRAPGMPDVFVPGAANIPGMGTYNTATNTQVKGKLSNLFHGYTREMERAGDPMGRSDIFRSFVGSLAEEHAPSGKGAGAFLRGKGILGSRFLTGVSEAGGQRTTSPFTVGLAEKHAMEMFDELAAHGDARSVEAMRKQFLEGKTIGGVVGRHPFIGQYSLQPVNFQILRGVDDAVMTLPSVAADIRLAGEAKANPINLSPMVGMAGDLDADIYAAYLVNPKVADKIQKQFTHANNQLNQDYISHQMRAQLIKAKAAGGGATDDITTSLKMIADAKKLATAQEWVGRLSNELSTAREAVGTRMSGQKAADARFLLEWLEQVPISGKHLKAQNVLNEEMSSFFQTIESSLRTRNPERMVGAVQGILRNSDTVSQRLLTEDIRIEHGAEQVAKAFGTAKRDFLPGIDLMNTVQDTMSALRLADATGETDMLKMATARKAVTEKTLPQYLDKMGMLLSRSEGVMAGLSSTKQIVTNLMAAAGESVIRNKKAIGFGFAGSIALATILSSPRETIGPGSQLSTGRVDMKPKAHKRMDQPQHAPEPPLGRPSVPSMINNSTSIAQAQDSVRMQIRARFLGKVDGSYVGNRMRMAGGRNTNVNVNVRDDSSSMNPHVLANKLF